VIALAGVTASAALLLYGAALCLYCAFAPTETLETPRMSKVFDAIVVGARCAGSPTAMLLARKGYRVLVVDRAAFPSDTLSTHILHPLGVSALSKWGLLERLAATGCPPIDTYAYDFGPVTLAGAPGTKARRSGTARGARSSTSSSSTRQCNPAPSCAKTSPSTSS
jgi:FAD binding domain